MRRVDHDRQMNHRVDAHLADKLSDRRVAGISVDEVHLLQGADRIRHVASEKVGHMRSEPPRDLGA